MSARPTPIHPVIRQLGVDDLDSLIRVEEASYPWPWTRGIFADCLRVGYCCTGLVLGHELAGYSIAGFGAGECHLLNLCVDPHWQGRGYGSMLLEHTMAQARAAGCETIFLEVRPSNPGAIALYSRRGFREIGRRKAYYRADQGREDALVMQMAL